MSRQKAIAAVAAAGAALTLAAAASAAEPGYGYETGTTPSETPAPTTEGGTKPAPGKTYVFRATMTARQEVPRAKAPARAAGSFRVTVIGEGRTRTLRWTLTFRNLSGKAVAAHIHAGKPGKAGGVLVPLCGPCVSGRSGTVKIRSDVADRLERGQAYANVHTARNPGGEIRGQLRRVGPA